MIKAEVISRRQIGFIPSASGIEIIEDNIYIIGDDSAYIYRLGLDYQQHSCIELFRSRAKPGEKIPKLLKGDLEAMATVNWQGRNLLLIMGSGSVWPDRDRGYLLNPDDTRQLFTLELTPVYDYIRDLLGLGPLNIEGITATQDNLYMVQRGNISGQNLLLKYDLGPFIGYLLHQNEIRPIPEVKPFDLGILEGVQAGFSGLNTLNEQYLLCTISVENTASTYDDGLVLGSYLGLINITSSDPQMEMALLADIDGKPIAEKAESVAVLKWLSDKEAMVLVVTDNDTEPSGLMEVKLTPA